MPRWCLAEVLIALLALESIAGAQTATVAIPDLPTGTRVEVCRTDGHQERGILIARTADSLSLAKKPGSTPHQIPIAQISSLRPVPKTHTPLGAWIATGVIVGIAVVAVIVYAEFRHNE